MLFAIATSSCGSSANHLAQYDLKGAPVFFTASIDHPSDEEASSSANDDSPNTWWKFFWALVSLPFTSHPEAFANDPSLPIFFSNGLAAELDDKLRIRDVDTTSDGRFQANVQITSIDLHSGDTACTVRVRERFRITHAASGKIVLDEDRMLEVPLRYCGSVQDTVSTSGPGITKERYRQLTDDEQLSALQCAVYDAGADLADSLSAMMGRAKPPKN